MVLAILLKLVALAGWLSWLAIISYAKRLWVWFPGRAHAGSNQSMFLTLMCLFLPSSLSKINKNILWWGLKNVHRTFVNSLLFEHTHFIYIFPHGWLWTRPACNCPAGLPHTPAAITHNPSAHGLRNFLVGRRRRGVWCWFWGWLRRRRKPWLLLGLSPFLCAWCSFYLFSFLPHLSPQFLAYSLSSLP